MSPSIDPKIIRRKIRELISERGPLTRSQLAAAFTSEEASPAEIEATLNKLISLQVLYLSPGNRISDKDDTQDLLAKGKEAIAKTPLSRNQLASALSRQDKGLPTQYLRTEFFDALAQEPDVYFHLGANGYVLSTQKPDFEKHIRPLAARYKQLSTVLEKAGHTPAEIQGAVTGAPVAAPKPSAPAPKALPPASTSDDLDFQRNAAELLVYSWQDSPCAETRQSLESVMLNLGLERVEEAGQVVEFNGLTLRGKQPLSQGDKVRIVQPGWRLRNGRGNHLIAKAEVEPA